jgi:hypothetical protein
MKVKPRDQASEGAQAPEGKSAPEREQAQKEAASA